MNTDVKLAAAGVLIAFVIVRAIVRRKGKVVELEEEVFPLAPTPAGKVRLTEVQQVALSSASLSQPIYAENRAGPISPDAEVYSPRTIDSLVKRGFLESNGKGGYTTTQEGMVALRNSMGY